MKNHSPYDSVIIIVIACIAIHLTWGGNFALWVGLLLSLAGLFSRKGVSLIHQGWMGLAEILGAISGTIILTLVYCILVVPFCFFIKKKEDLWLHQRDHQYSKEDLEKPW